MSEPVNQPLRGSNATRHYESRPDGSVQVGEIMYTIQREGIYAGYPAVFVRLSGCNLRCHFCDTYWADESDPMMTPRMILDHVRSKWPPHNHITLPLIVLTGGEPLRQDIEKLLDELIDCGGYHVQIETAGTLWQRYLNTYSSHQLTIIVCPKTPKINDDIPHRANAFKYVVGHDDKLGERGIPITATQGGEPRQLALPEPAMPVFLSPRDDFDEEKNRKNRYTVAQVALAYGHRAGLQLHKFFGVD